MSLLADRTQRVTAASHAGFDRRETVLLAGGLISMVALIALRAAWVSDTAYLTLRVADNFIHGYGLRWNVAERVQVYAHPLWLLLVTAAYALTRETYFTTLALDLILTVLALLVLVRLARSPLTGALGIVMLLFSRAYVGFSTSGLENPLSHVLLALFLLFALGGRAGRWSVAPLAFVASLTILARLDNAFIVLPVVALAAVRSRGWRTWVALGAGLLPVVSWEVFAVVYYGFPLPNAAYARLSAGLPSLALVRQGVVYLLDSMRQDPLTIATTVVGVVVAAVIGSPLARAAASGVVLHLLYVAVIGGDELSGRLLTPPLLTSVCLLVGSIDVGRLGVARYVLFLLIPAIGVWSPGNPLIPGSFDDRGSTGQRGATVDDERRLENSAGSLSDLRLGVTPPSTDNTVGAFDLLQKGRTVVAAEVVGVLGFAAGPRLHIVDVRGDMDPLMARVPPDPNVPPVGARRTVPDGYLGAIQSGRAGVGLGDPRIAACYARLSLIEQQPIWSWTRMGAILRENLGKTAFSCQ